MDILQFKKNAKPLNQNAGVLPVVVDGQRNMAHVIASSASVLEKMLLFKVFFKE